MDNVKYKDYRIGKHLFTVKFERCGEFENDPMVSVSVWQQHQPHRFFIHRIIDFFKYECYWHATWLGSRSEGTLDEYAIGLCTLVIENWDQKAKAEKFWNDLDK